MRAIGRSASRGLGPARQTDDAGRRGNGLGMHRWLATAKHHWRKEFGCRGYVVDAAGEIDTAGLVMNSVVTGARGAVGIKFALQKNDARCLECICSCSSGFRWCPACHLK